MRAEVRFEITNMFSHQRNREYEDVTNVTTDARLHKFAHDDVFTKLLLHGLNGEEVLNAEDAHGDAVNQTVKVVCGTLDDAAFSFLTDHIVDVAFQVAVVSVHWCPLVLRQQVLWAATSLHN